MAERIDREELRLLIREALKEALVGSPSPSRSAAAPSTEKRGSFRFDSGVLNESKVAEIGKTHAKIVIGAEVAVTPLARDRAREIRIEIVRQKP
jgi:hypothetical protein